MCNRRMAVEGSGHVTDKSATFFRPLSTVEDQKVLKQGSGTEVKLKPRMCVSQGRKQTCKDRCVIYTHAYTSVQPFIFHLYPKWCGPG
jgi:hypothetical protein